MLFQSKEHFEILIHHCMPFTYIIPYKTSQYYVFSWINIIYMIVNSTGTFVFIHFWYEPSPWFNINERNKEKQWFLKISSDFSRMLKKYLLHYLQLCLKLWALIFLPDLFFRTLYMTLPFPNSGCSLISYPLFMFSCTCIKFRVLESLH